MKQRRAETSHDDLASRATKRRVASRLISVKVPPTVLKRIDRVAANSGATKTQVVLEILNESLQSGAAERLGTLAARKAGRRSASSRATALKRKRATDRAYLRGLEATLSEWNSECDDQAYADL